MQSSKQVPIQSGKHEPSPTPAKQKLTDQEIHDLLRKYPDWAVENGMLVRFWTFNGFVEAIAFVNRVAQLAEQSGHHPDIDIRYNRVRLGLVSHDAGGITARDAQMAAKLSSGFQVARSA